ncbi:TIGR00153 family protein [Candidatus Aminicenantes bacterium AH-873-B07]|jgi:hypothetical protein|nr:TIGR00153 family protein [Candidatus Aminicenantes bacterium AH-873-B07]
MKFLKRIALRFSKPYLAPLYSHAKRTMNAVQRIKEVIHAYCDIDLEKLIELDKEISEIEHEADKIKQNIRSSLPSSVLLPIERQDLLEFLSQQDRIADRAQDVSRLTTFKKPAKLNKEIKESLIKMSEKVVEAVEKYEKIIKKIENILSISPPKKELSKVFKQIEEVERIEHEADLIQIELAKKIFNSEIDPINVFHLSQIIQTLDDIADASARAGDRLRTMLYR